MNAGVLAYGGHAELLDFVEDLTVWELIVEMATAGDDEHAIEIKGLGCSCRCTWEAIYEYGFQVTTPVKLLQGTHTTLITSVRYICESECEEDSDEEAESEAGYVSTDAPADSDCESSSSYSI